MLTELHLQYRRRLNTVLTLFGLGILTGALASFSFPEFMDQILSTFAERFGEAPALNLALAWEIFRQNVMVSALAWLGGLLLGIVPAVIVLANGFILGYVVLYFFLASGNAGDSLLVLGLGLVPHGIVEIPAFLAAAVLGLSLGLDWLAQGAQGQRLATLRQTATRTAKHFAVIILALAIAAIIEVFVSGRLVDNL